MLIHCNPKNKVGRMFGLQMRLEYGQLICDGEIVGISIYRILLHIIFSTTNVHFSLIITAFYNDLFTTLVVVNSMNNIRSFLFDKTTSPLYCFMITVIDFKPKIRAIAY